MSEPKRHKINGKYAFTCGQNILVHETYAWFWKDVTCKRCLSLKPGVKKGKG